MGYDAYHSIDNVEEYINADALQFVQYYMIQSLPSELTEGVRYIHPLTTGGWNTGSWDKYREGGGGFDILSKNDYKKFFGVGNKFSELKRVLFPLHVNGNHYVGAVAYPSEGTVATFDSFGKSRRSHLQIFQWVSSLLNHALDKDEVKRKEWKHHIMDVPIQEDGVNCGLFRTVNGIIISLFDDPSSDVLKKLLVKQDQIESIRAKMAGIILSHSTLKYEPNVMKEKFAEVKAEEAQLQLQKREAKRRAKLNPVPENSKGVLLIDPEQADLDELDKLSKKKSTESKTTSKNKAPSQSASSSAFQLPTSVTYSAEVKARRLLHHLKEGCEYGHLFPSLTAQFPTDENMQYCFNTKSRGSGDGVATFKAKFSEFCKIFNIHCEQVLCLVDLSQQIWPKLDSAAVEDSFRRSFAEYYLRTIVSILRASSILSNGKPLVKSDVSAHHHCVDLILQSDRRTELTIKYKGINSKKAGGWKKRSLESVAGWTATMHDTFRHIEDMLQNVSTKYCTWSVTKGELTVRCALSMGNWEVLKRRIYQNETSSAEYKNSEPSHPRQLDFFEFRYDQLKTLFLMCKKNNAPVPLALEEALQDHVKESVEFAKLKEEKKKKRRRIICDEEEDSSSEEEMSAEKSSGAGNDTEKLVDGTPERKQVAAKKDDGDDGSEMEISEKETSDKTSAKKAEAEAEKKKEISDKTSAEKSSGAGNDMVDDTPERMQEVAKKDDGDDDSKEEKPSPTEGDAKMMSEGAETLIKFASNDGDDGSKEKEKETSEKETSDKTSAKKAEAEKKKEISDKTERMQEVAKKAEGDDDSKEEKPSPTEGAETLIQFASMKRQANGSTTSKKRKLKQSHLTSHTSSARSESKRVFVHSMDSAQFHSTKLSKSKRRSGITTRVVDGTAQTFVDVQTAAGAPLANNNPTQICCDDNVIELYTNKTGKNDDAATATTTTSVFHPHPKHSKQQQKRNANTVYNDIKTVCALLRKQVQRNHTVRDTDVFKNSYTTSASSLIIRDVDNVEVVDHFVTNFKRYHLLVRTTFPTKENHELIRMLQQQLDDATYNMMKTAMNMDGLVLLAFVTLYNKSSSERFQQNVDGMSFHSLILMQKPSTDSTATMKVPVMWTSAAYNGATLDRLVQIGCLVFWGSEQSLQIKTPTNFSATKIQWERHEETVKKIALRLYGGHPFCEMTGNMHTWAAKAEEKTSKMIPDMVYNLKALLQSTVEQFASVKNSKKEEVNTKTEKLVAVPLGFFTHFLSPLQSVTELGAELLQSASIKPASLTTVRQGFVFQCNCCGDAMNSPVDFVMLIKLGRSIIIQHNFGDADDNINLSHALGPLHEEDDVPDEFVITTCRPRHNLQAYAKRQRFFDAMTVDLAKEKNSRQRLTCNLLGLLSLLLPTEVAAETLTQFPLVDALSKMFSEDPAGSMTLREGHIMKVNCMETVLRGRPIQVVTKTIDVDPISDLKPHGSWEVNNGDSKRGSVDEVFARFKEGDSCNVGNLVVNDRAISAHTPRDGQGDATLFMLSYYYAKYVIVIEAGMTFNDVKDAVKGSNITLPQELKTLMDKCDITCKTLVVITDCPKRPKKCESLTSDDVDVRARLSHITHMYKSLLTWFIPTDPFLMLLPKEDVSNLRDGKTPYFEISKELRKKIQEPIYRSLEYEFKRIRLYSKEPNMVYEVTLTSGKIIHIDVSKMLSDWTKDLQEPWLLEHLTSLCYVSGRLGIHFGIGKKAQVAQRAAMHPSPASNVWWYDPSNYYNLCVFGAIANWHHAEGLVMEATRMKEWALIQNLSRITDDQMKIALEYIRQHCHIGNARINFNSSKPELTLQETVNMAIDFPAPTILEFGSLSSRQTHCVVVSKRRVYDLQDRDVYHLSEKSLIRKLNRDTMLVSARYFFLLKPEMIRIESCPDRAMVARINSNQVNVPYMDILIRSFGEKRKRKRKRK